MRLQHDTLTLGLDGRAVDPIPWGVLRYHPAWDPHLLEELAMSGEELRMMFWTPYGRRLGIVNCVPVRRDGVRVFQLQIRYALPYTLPNNTGGTAQASSTVQVRNT